MGKGFNMEILKAKGGEGSRVRQQHRLNQHGSAQTPGDSEGQEKREMLQSMGSQRVGHSLAIEQP